MSINNKNDKYNKYITSDLIPSSTLRSYYIDNYINLTENQLVRCASEYGQLGLDAQRKIYKEVMANTDDKQLATYLDNEINLIDFYLSKVSEQNDSYISALYIYDSPYDEPEEVGLYKAYKTAEDVGRNSRSWFSIKRHIVNELTARNDSHSLELCVDYNAKGEVISVKYMLDDDEKYREVMNRALETSDYFDEVYCDFPFPFESGDLVRIVSARGTKPDIGIVYGNDKDKIQSLLSKGIAPDDELYCEFCDTDGEFDYSSVSPVYLDRVSIEEAPEKLKDVLQSASRLVKGKGSIYDLQFFQKRL